MKIFSLIVGIFALLCIIYYAYAVIINYKLNRKKIGMFVKKRANKYALFLIISIVIFLSSATYLIFGMLEKKFNPIETFDLSKDYDKVFEQNSDDDLYYNPVVSLLNDYSCEVEENDVVYGITSTQVYKINCTNNEYITRNGEVDSNKRSVILVSDYVAVSYAYDNTSKVIVYNKDDLEIHQTIIIDGEIINVENIDNKISLLVNNDIKKDIGVIINDNNKQYLKEIKYLKNTNISKIISHISIDIETEQINQKGFCLEDFYFTYDEYYYYIVGNMYIDEKRENKCFIFRYDPQILKIVNYAFFYGNAYMCPYATLDYIYMNTYDQDNNAFYAYQLNDVLNVCSRVGVDSSDNEVLDYLLNKAKVYNLSDTLYVENYVFTDDWSAFRDQEDIIVLQKIDNQLYINKYLYNTNTFQQFNVTFEDAFDEIVILSYNNNGKEVKLLFRTQEKVGYIKFNLETNESIMDARSGGCRMFITDEKIIIIDNNELEIIE